MDGHETPARDPFPHAHDQEMAATPRRSFSREGFIYESERCGRNKLRFCYGKATPLAARSLDLLAIAGMMIRVRVFFVQLAVIDFTTRSGELRFLRLLFRLLEILFAPAPGKDSAARASEPLQLPSRKRAVAFRHSSAEVRRGARSAAYRNYTHVHQITRQTIPAARVGAAAASRRGGSSNRSNESTSRNSSNSSSSSRGSRDYSPRQPKKLTLWQKIVAFFTGGSKPAAKPAARTSAPASKPAAATEPKAERKPRTGMRKPEAVEVTSPRLYVGNLSFDATESDLFDLFNGIGIVQNVEVVSNRQTQRSKGFAFVQMQTVGKPSAP